MTPKMEPARPTPRYGEGRAALLAAAVRVVADEGLRKLTSRAVAREAGVAHGLVAHHFGTRDALIEAALEFSLGNSMPSISTDPGSGDLEALFAGLATTVERNPEDLAFQYELILESRRRPELRPHVEAVYRVYLDTLQFELKCAGFDPDPALSHLIYTAVDGLVFHQITVGQPELTERSLAHLRALLEQSRSTRNADKSLPEPNGVRTR